MHNTNFQQTNVFFKTFVLLKSLIQATDIYMLTYMFVYGVWGGKTYNIVYEHEITLSRAI